MIIPPATLPRESLSASAIATTAPESAARSPVVEIPSALSAERITIICSPIFTALIKNFSSERSIFTFLKDFVIILRIKTII